MKKMLMASAAVGAAIAGLILYARRSNGSATKELGSAAKDAYRKMNNGLGKLERNNPAHSMG